MSAADAIRPPKRTRRARKPPADPVGAGPLAPDPIQADSLPADPIQADSLPADPIQADPVPAAPASETPRPSTDAKRSASEPADATRTVPRGRVWRTRRDVRYRLMQGFLWLLTHAYLRFRIENLERLPPPPYVLCFNHLDWADPLILVAVLPAPRRIYFFGPRERDMHVGWRNRLMTWVGNDVPFKPDKSHMVDTVRRVKDVLAAGYPLAIAGEGRVAEREDEVLPLNEGAAFFALHGQVPLVAVAVNGTRVVRFGKRIRVRVGAPILTAGRRPSKEEVAALTGEAHALLSELVKGYTDPVRPSRFDLWITELFNGPKRGAPVP